VPQLLVLLNPVNQGSRGFKTSLVYKIPVVKEVFPVVTDETIFVL
jgi:hypothetical protein